MRKVLDHDPLTGITQYWDENEATGEISLIDEFQVADTKAIVDQNKRMEGQGMGKEWRLAASIPPQVQYEWLDKYGVEFWNPAHADGVKRLLNDPDYRYLRINWFQL